MDFHLVNVQVRVLLSRIWLSFFPIHHFLFIIIIIISLFSGANWTSKAPRPTYSSPGTFSTVSQKRPQTEHYYGQHRVNRSRHAVQQQQRNGRRRTCSFWPLPASDVQHYVSQNDDYQPSSSPHTHTLSVCLSIRTDKKFYIITALQPQSLLLLLLSVIIIIIIIAETSVKTSFFHQSKTPLCTALGTLTHSL